MSYLRRQDRWNPLLSTVVSRDKFPWQGLSHRVTVFLFLSLVLFLPLTGLWSIRKSDYAIGDWLIDYSQGFVRRGLAGEFFEVISRLIGVETIVVVLVALTILYASYLLLAYQLYRQQPFEIARLGLLLSPGFLAGFALVGVRKEIIIYVFLTLFIFLMRRGDKAKVVALVTAALSGPVSVLVHEGLVFTIPFMAIAIALSFREGLISPEQAWWSGLTSLAGSAIAFGFSFHFRGNPQIAEAICKGKNAEGPAKDICSGIYPLGDSTSFALDSVIGMIQQHGYLLVYPIAIVLSLIPFVAVKFSKFVLGALLLASLSLVPLAVVGIDWGRWILIGTTATTLLVFGFAGGRDILIRQFPRPFNSHPFVFFLVLAYSTTWSIPIYGQSQLGIGLLGEVLSRIFPIWEIQLWPLLSDLASLVTFA